MGQPGFEVDPERLPGIAAAVADAAETARTAHRHELAPTGVWAVARAAEAASGAWRTYLDRLGRDLDALGAELRTAAETYATTEDSAARRFDGRPPR